jgi:hypothetical protein
VILGVVLLAGCQTTTIEEARQTSKIKAAYLYDVPYQLAHKKLLEYLTIESVVDRQFNDWDSRRIFHAIYCDLHCSTIYREEYLTAALIVRYVLDLQAQGENRCRIDLSAATERDQAEIEAAMRKTLGEPNMLPDLTEGQT